MAVSTSYGTGSSIGSSNERRLRDGCDNLDNNIPPDLLTIVRQGNNVGWPYCRGNRHLDPDVPPPAGFCARITLPTFVHAAALGRL